MSYPGSRMGWQKPDELRGRKEEEKQESSTQGLRDRLRGGLNPSRYVRNTFLRVAELFLKICKSQLSRWQWTLSDEAMPFHLSIDAFFFSDRNMSLPSCLSVSPPPHTHTRGRCLSLSWALLLTSLSLFLRVPPLGPYQHPSQKKPHRELAPMWSLREAQRLPPWQGVCHLCALE